MVEVQNIIDGEWREAAGGRMYEVNNPAHPSQIVGRAALANQDDVRDAINAAHRAYPAWAALSYAERAERLTAAAAPLAADENRLNEMIHLFTREHGKILKESAIEFSRFGDRFAWPVAQAGKLAQDEKLSGPPQDTIITHQPRGVASQIVPWNWPISLLGVKTPPALMTGNTVVIKLAEQSPLAPMLLLKMLADGLPPGVINVIASPPSEIGDEMISNPLVRKISFTGSIRAGKHIMKVAADTLKAITLELGGNDAALVMDDADLNDECMQRFVNGSFMTAGQICMAIKRIYVHRSRYDEFVEKFVSAVDRIVVGDGTDPSVTMGPINNERQLKVVQDLIDDSRRSGATVRELGQIADDATYKEGYFQRPVVVTDCEPNSRIVQEEQFGPVVPILAFDTDDEAIQQANNTEFGLCSSVWTADRDRAVAMARRLEAGYTYINGHGPMAQDHRGPFGGMKQSGIGRVLGFEGMSEFMEPHSISAPPGWLF
ncbi:MAG: aldehyde dehydrogenase family protein [Proteobacteria bacterium]|nr:aldehyde dehydrogenase family protein [Pseudomonadota bacterium]MDA0992200.1 aldehyde dehydrogenase family protein [Pseudomonadota bacterium]